MRPQHGHVAGSVQTLLLQVGHKYPPTVGFEWHAQKLGSGSAMRDGKPIFNNAALSSSCSFLPAPLPVGSLPAFTGGIVARMKSSRKCCSLRATP